MTDLEVENNDGRDSPRPAIRSRDSLNARALQEKERKLGSSF